MSLPLGEQIRLLLDEMNYDKERLTMAEDLLNEAWCHITDQDLRQKISDYLKENILSRQ